MAAAAIGGVQRYQQDAIQNTNDVVYDKVLDLLIARTGHQPTTYWHLYEFKKHLDKFIHPNPGPSHTGRRVRTRPLGLASDRIPEQLTGWNDLDDDQKDELLLIYNRFTTDDLQLAFDRFYQRLGRLPTAEEFARYLLTLEGNDSTDSSRKTLGNLFLENEEFKRGMEECNKSLESYKEMMESKDIMYNTLSEAYLAHLAQIEDLETEKQQYRDILRIVQVERTQLQEEKNVLTMDLTFEQRKNEDLRQEKMRLESKCSHLLSENSKLEENYGRIKRELREVEEKMRFMDEMVLKVQSYLSQIESKLEGAEMNVENLLKENGLLKEGIFRLEQTLNSVTDDKCRLEQTLNSVTDDKCSLELDNCRLEQTLNSVTDDKCRLEQTLNSVTDDKCRLEQTLNSVTDDKCRLEQTLNSVTDDKCRLEQTLNSVTDDKCRLELDNCRLEQTLISVTDDKCRLEQTLNSVTDDKCRLEQTLNSVTDDKCRLELDNCRLEQTLISVTDDKCRLEQTLNSVTDDKCRLEQALIDMADDRSRLELYKHDKTNLERQLLFFKSIFVIVILGFILAAFNMRLVDDNTSLS